MIERVQESGREPGGGGSPVTDAGPPTGGVVVPAGVDAEVLGSYGGRGVDERQESGLGRITHERVHVVVEDHRQGRVLRMLPTGPATVAGQVAECSVEIRAEGEGDGHGGDRAIGRQVERPVVILVVGTGDRDVATVQPIRARSFADLDVPAAVVLDLPGQRDVRAAQPDGAGRIGRPARPGAVAGPAEPPGCGFAPGTGKDPAESPGAERVPVPAVLRRPAGGRHPHLEVVEVVTDHCAGGQTGDQPDRQRVRAVGQSDHTGDAHRRRPVCDLQQGCDPYSTGRVVLGDREPLDRAVGFRDVMEVAQPGPDHGAVDPRAVAVPTVAGGQDLDERLFGEHGGIAARDVGCRDVHQAQGPVPGSEPQGQWPR